MKITFDTIAKVFGSAMVKVFDRWADEYQYEKAAFVKYFSPMAAKFGGTVVRVTGTATKMTIRVSFGTKGMSDISLTASGKFQVKTVK